jgi:Bacterial archaeo-eukaryotic release factor family 10
MKEPSRSKTTTVGVLLLSADGATIGEWSPRRVEELQKLELPVTEAAEHELLGPSHAHPRGSGERATAARSSNQRDLWERRMDEHRVRFARSAAATTAKIAKRRSWDVVLVLGDPRRTGPACDELDDAAVDAVPIGSVLDWMRPAALAKRLAPDVERARTVTQR